MNITVNHRNHIPFYVQIRNQIKEMILKGEIADGAFLPSERTLARLTGVHRNTVIRAYNELKADGYVVASQGKGYQVTYRSYQEQEQEPQYRSSQGQQGPCAAAEGAQAARRQERGREVISWKNFIKDSFLDMETTFDDLFSRSYDNGNISFAGGIASPDAYFGEELSDILADLIAETKRKKDEKDDIYAYTPYQGLFELRQAIVLFLKGKGINVRHGEIQIVSESNQAIDFLAELLIHEGDTVITEEPISPDAFRELKLAGANIVTVPIDEEGMITDRIEPLILKHHPRLIYVNSSFQDPTGVVMSLERRKALLALSRKYQVPILEDDGASEITYERKAVPSLKALDTGNSVIYVYSFALTFAPGICLAFVAAPRIVIKNLSHLISLHLINFDSLSQRILCEYLQRGIYQKNIRRIRDDYREKRDLMCRLLEPARKLGVSYAKPGGGVYLWCRLPADMELSRLIERAGKLGVTFIPGSIFFPYGTKGDEYIRLNYSYPGKQQIRRGVKLLLSAMRESKK